MTAKKRDAEVPAPLEPQTGKKVRGTAEQETAAESAHDDGCSCGCAEHTAEGLPLESLPDEELLYDLADLFKVFGDTTRIKILYALMGTQRCVADIAELIGATQSAVSVAPAAHPQAGAPREVSARRQKRYLLAVGRPCIYHALAGPHAHL